MLAGGESADRPTASPPRECGSVRADRSGGSSSTMCDVPRYWKQGGSGLKQLLQTVFADSRNLMTAALSRHRRRAPLREQPRRVCAYKRRRKSIMAALTSDARSCWVQWPQPGSRIVSCSLGTKLDKLATS
jgi:hypothetical protein